MSKGLKALEGIKDLLPHLDKPYIKIIEAELKRLEKSEIDVGTWKEIAEHKQKEFDIIHEECVRLTKIKNKQDEILRIIKEIIGIGYIKVDFKAKQNFGEDEVAYYIIINGLAYRLKTQAEFDLLKGWLL